MSKIVINADDELAKLIDEGVSINSQIKPLTARLDKLKGIFRNEAEKELLESTESASTIELVGVNGTVKITFSDSSLEVKQDKAEALKVLFGDFFDKIFEIKIVIKDKKTLNSLLEKESNGFKSAVEKCMIKKASTPRVSF